MKTKKTRYAWSTKTANAAARKRWGDKFVGSIFPVSDGKHRVTLFFKGKQYTFAGVDRLEVLDKAFSVLRTK